jgi:hypothetical protein
MQDKELQLEDTVSADRKERMIYVGPGKSRKISSITSRQNFDNEKFTRNKNKGGDEEGEEDEKEEVKESAVQPCQSDMISQDKKKKSNSPQIEFVTGTEKAGSSSTAIGNAQNMGIKKISEALVEKAIKQVKGDDLPFDPDTKAEKEFKKPNNPNRSPMDTVRALAQKGMEKQKSVKEEIEPVDEALLPVVKSAFSKLKDKFSSKPAAAPTPAPAASKPAAPAAKPKPDLQSVKKDLDIAHDKKKVIGGMEKIKAREKQQDRIKAARKGFADYAAKKDKAVNDRKDSLYGKGNRPVGVAAKAAAFRAQIQKDKLAKSSTTNEELEQEQIDQLQELDTSTLKSYINKANPEVKAAKAERQSAREGGDLQTADSARRTADKRTAGIKQAKAKLNKEGQEMKTYQEFLDQLLEYTPGPGGVTRVQGRSYGAQYHDPEGDDDADDKAPAAKAADAPKRGRGRPAGSKSGANQKVTTGKSYGGIATHSLHLPNSK